MGRPLRALLVEDSPKDATLLLRELRKGDYEVAHRRVDTAEAMHAALEEQTWDIIISDHAMPRFSALQALALAREKGLDTPFIIASGVIGEEAAVEAMRAGAQDYVLKDNLARLLPAVARELQEAVVRRERREAEAALARRAQQLAVINEVSLAISSRMETQSVLAAVVEAACHLVSAGIGAAVLRDPKTGQLSVSAVHKADFYPHDLGAFCAAGPPKGGGIAKALLAGRALRIADLESSPLFSGIPAGHPELRGLLGAPLSDREGRSIGFVMTSWREAGEFSQEDADLLLLLARQASIALENARLYREAAEASKDWSETFDAMPELVCLMDTSGAILRANVSLARLAGVAPEELAGRDFYEVVSGRRTPLEGFPEGGARAISKDLRLPSLSPEGIFEVTTQPVTGKEGKIRAVIMIAREVTDHRRLQAQLLQTQKLAALGEFVAGIAHELNNPLASVVALAQLLRQEKLPAAISADLHNMEKEALRASRIVQNLLTFARRREAQREYVEINELLAETLALQAHRLQLTEVIAVTDFAPDLPRVWADAHQLQQVFVNLLNNALSAMLETSEERRLTVTTAKAQDALRVRVRDTGPGIPPDVIGRVFDPFFTTRPTGQGTGLGLSISYGIVKEHNGEISVSSRVGEGTEFVIDLPLSGQPAQPKTPAEPPPTVIPLGAQVLVVEDEFLIRAALVRLLEEQGHRVTAVKDAAGALEALASQEFDAVLCDMKMPGKDGRELYNEVHLRWPQAASRFIFCTGDTMSAETWAFIERENLQALTKPFLRSDLQRALARVLAPRPPQAS